MNRQALAFLTMFSLILMLSVYYVTLPYDTTSVMSTQDGEELDDSKQNEEQVNDAEKLQKEITSKQESEVKKNSDVVSDSKSSDAQKQEALETIDTLKGDQANTEALKQELEKAGFMSESTEGTCKISVFDSEDNEANAKKVMKIASDATENKYLIEVTFK